MMNKVNKKYTKMPRKITRRNYRKYLPPVFVGMKVEYLDRVINKVKVGVISTYNHFDGVIGINEEIYAHICDVKKFTKTREYYKHVDRMIRCANIYLPCGLDDVYDSVLMRQMNLLL